MLAGGSDSPASSRKAISFAFPSVNAEEKKIVASKGISFIESDDVIIPDDTSASTTTKKKTGISFSDDVIISDETTTTKKKTGISFGNAEVMDIAATSITHDISAEEEGGNRRRSESNLSSGGSSVGEESEPGSPTAEFFDDPHHR